MASSAICGARQGRGGGETVSEDEVRASLAAINAVYPGTNICCVMAPTGTVLCVDTQHIARSTEHAVHKMHTVHGA